MTPRAHEEIRHPDGVVMEPTGDGLVVYLPSPESLHLLDGPAALVWVLADGRSPADVCSAVAARFPGTPRLPEDVVRTLDDMVERGLLADGRSL
jgi:hypothetical protein